MFLFFSFLTGLAVGSFCNVILTRFTPESAKREGFSLWQAIQGRSYCDSCHRTLHWFELLPLVSFFVQRGRCRVCQARLSLQYPVVELLTALGFLALSWKITRLFPLTLTGWSVLPDSWILGLIFLWWAVFTVLLLIAAYDFKFYLIPDLFLYALLGLGLGLNLYYWWLAKAVSLFPATGLLFSAELGYLLGGVQFSLERVALGMMFGVAVIGLSYLLSRGRAMGFGDVLLALGLGLIFGWPDTLLVMFLGFAFGTLASLVLLTLKYKTLKSIVPFGPFLVLAALTLILAGDKIVAAYLRLFLFVP